MLRRTIATAQRAVQHSKSQLRTGCAGSCGTPRNRQRICQIVTLLVVVMLGGVLLLLYMSDARYMRGRVTPHHYFALNAPIPPPVTLADDDSYEPPSAVEQLERPRSARIAIVTMSQFSPNSHGHTIARWSFLNKFRYAREHGYSLYFHTRKHVSWWRPAVWGKISILLHHMRSTTDQSIAGPHDSHESGDADTAIDARETARRGTRTGSGDRVRYRYDWLLWIDTDTVVMEQQTRIEELIHEFTRDRPAVSESNDEPHPVPALFATDDHRIRPLNAGVMLIRNCAWSRALFASLFHVKRWPRLLHWEQEQRALADALAESRALERGLWVRPPAWRFNPLNSEYTRAMGEEELRQHNGVPPFLIHTAGCSSEDQSKLSCGANYRDRAWRLYLRRWGLNQSHLPFDGVTSFDVLPHPLVQYVRDAYDGQPLETIFPELFAI